MRNLIMERALDHSHKLRSCLAMSVCFAGDGSWPIIDGRRNGQSRGRAADNQDRDDQRRCARPPASIDGPRSAILAADRRRAMGRPADLGHRPGSIFKSILEVGKACVMAGAAAGRARGRGRARSAPRAMLACGECRDRACVRSLTTQPTPVECVAPQALSRLAGRVTPTPMMAGQRVIGAHVRG